MSLSVNGWYAGSCGQHFLLLPVRVTCFFLFSLSVVTLTFCHFMVSGTWHNKTICVLQMILPVCTFRFFLLVSSTREKVSNANFLLFLMGLVLNYFFLYSDNKKFLKF